MSISTPPGGFVDLAAAYKRPPGNFVSIIGVVVDFMEPGSASTGQHMLTFKLLDYRLSMATEGSQGLKCRAFTNDVESLPKVRNLGDVVLLRNVKMLEFEHQPVAVVNFTTTCLVFPGSSIPDPRFGYAYANKPIERLGREKDKLGFKLLEQQYVINIKEEMKTRLQQIQQVRARRPVSPSDDSSRGPKRARLSDGSNAAVGGFGKKFRLIKDLHTWNFADIVGFAVKCFPNQYGGCDLYVTDYTAHEALRYYPAPEEDVTLQERDGDEFGYSNVPKKGWRGPFGQLVLKVNLKSPHAAFAAQHVQEGDIVLLRNVKRRLLPGSALMEGDMWPDHQDPDKIKIHVVKDTSGQECQDMMKRREAYWLDRESNLQQAEQAAAQQKSKKTSRRREKRQRKAAAAAAASSTADAFNVNVKCEHVEGSGLMKIRDILDPENTRHTNETPHGVRYALPFINARYRAQVRVVDFHPRTLEEFATQPGIESSIPDSDDWSLKASPKHEWTFSLLLEEAGEKGKCDGQQRLWVHLHHEQAQYLLREMPDPDDLRHSPQLLQALRQKLFILWGNLEERGKGEAIDNKPFQCHIEEYGIELDHVDDGTDSALKGYQRMYTMYGTTIL